MHTSSKPTTLSSCFTILLAFVVTLILAFPLQERALADEGDTTQNLEELRSQANSVFASIDALQSKLNDASIQYSDAIAERNSAVSQMEQARKTIGETELEMAKLQGEISSLAADMYKREKTGGSLAFIDVLLGASNFTEFAAGLDMMSRVNQQNSELIAKAKSLREQSEAAYAQYAEQKDIAEKRMEDAQQTQLTIARQQAALTAEVTKITADIVEVEAQAELEAEAARKAEAAAKEAAKALSESIKAGEKLDVGSGFLANPCPGSVESSGWGYREFDDKFHKGTDMAAPLGTPIYAAEAGTVIHATNDGGYNEGAGNWVVIAHGNGLVTKYMHASVVFVKAGDTVERGQNIALVGSTGKSTGPHLHFQVEYNGSAICPYDFL